MAGMKTDFPSNCFSKFALCGSNLVVDWKWWTCKLFPGNVGLRITRGTQYRHGVYYHNDAQKKMAEKVIKAYGEDCVTECLPAAKFYIAKEYHQQYLLKGGQSARKGEDSTIRCYG
jgi:hypothetical protein